MYCVKCGVKLADTEERCPLCSTAPGEIPAREEMGKSLYPKDRYPEPAVKRNAVNGTVLFLYLIPLLVLFFVDLQHDMMLEWFWYAAGALIWLYIAIALPYWFRKPNPVIFVPCDFAAMALYLLMIDILTKGGWFLGFALPVTACFCLIVTAVVTLMRYVRKGKLYIFGGAMIAMGAAMLLVEGLATLTFDILFTGWSVYPLIALAMLGGLLIFLAINSTARERMERKFFF